MQARIKLNLFLLGLIIVLAVYLTRTEAPTPVGQMFIPLSTIDPATVNHIQTSRPGMPDLILQKSGTDWQITSPVQVPANPFRVSSLLELLQTRSISTVTTVADAFGIADSQVTLSFNNNTFKFGNINTLDQSRYILFENTVHLIEDRLYDQLLQDVAFFADKRLLPEASTLVRIKVPDIELAYINNSWTQLSGATPLPVIALSELALRWSQLEATRISIATVASVPADIVLETNAGELIELAFISGAPELLLQRIDTGMIYHYPAHTAIELGVVRQVN